MVWYERLDLEHMHSSLMTSSGLYLITIDIPDGASWYSKQCLAKVHKEMNACLAAMSILFFAFVIVLIQALSKAITYSKYIPRLRTGQDEIA